MFSKAKIQELMTKFAKVNVNEIQDASLRAKAAELKQKQGGFTLLELLVVVAILAAIAGTASIALKDTDARAAAAAHVAMMDELNKGIRTFRVLNRNVLPTRFDSLGASADGSATGIATISTLANEDVAFETVDADIAGTDGVIQAGGIDALMVINNAAFAEGDATVPADACSDLDTAVLSRANSLVAGNIFLENHCGVEEAMEDFASLPMWTGGGLRITGTSAQDDANHDADGNTAFMILGVGPASNLFDPETYGSMTTVPVYRHVSGSDYNRFQAVFKIGTYDSANTDGGTDGLLAADQMELMAIVDGAGDTKEEELGEWDGSRNTI